MSSSYMQGPCGGPQFRYIDDGHIEVDGSIPTHDITNKNYAAVIDRMKNWKDLIYKYSNKYNISPAIIAGVMAQESGGNPKSLSNAQAIGLMQIIPSTGMNWGKKFLGRPVHSDELRDPNINIELGTAGLADSMNRHGNNIVKVAAEYNHGANDCGVYCLRNKDTKKIISCCSPDKWGLKTDCGYINGVITWTNTMIGEGYSGNLILLEKKSVWGVVAFLGVMLAGGIAVGYVAKNGWFSSNRESGSWHS